MDLNFVAAYYGVPYVVEQLQDDEINPESRVVILKKGGFIYYGEVAETEVIPDGYITIYNGKLSEINSLITKS